MRKGSRRIAREGCRHNKNQPPGLQPEPQLGKLRRRARWLCPGAAKLAHREICLGEGAGRKDETKRHRDFQWPQLQAGDPRPRHCFPFRLRSVAPKTRMLRCRLLLAPPPRGSEQNPHMDREEVELSWCSLCLLHCHRDLLPSFLFANRDLPGQKAPTQQAPTMGPCPPQLPK